MKTIGEKAKRYDEALERARNIVNSINVGLIGKDSFEAVFPELKESEDEKIRKQVVYAINQLHVCECTKNKLLAWLEKQDKHLENYDEAEEEKADFVGDGFIECHADFLDFKEGNTYWLEYIGDDKYNVRSDNLLGKTYHITPCQLYTIFKKQTWLEKQGELSEEIEYNPFDDFRNSDVEVDSNEDGLIAETIRYKKETQGEQKPADKVEPKFHEGDWIVFNGLTLLIKEVVKGYYRTISKNGIVNSYDWNIDNAARLWTINEAKYGDVLVHNSIIFIFVGIENGIVKGICAELSDTILNFGEPEYDNDYCPATKEQRDTLLKSMTDAGYTFDFEKKELKKIDNEIEIPFGAKDSELQEATYYIPKGFHAEIDDDKVVIKKDGKLTAWSEEDEHRLEDTIYFLDTAKKHYASTVELDACIDWLKSLRPQPKQKWSEEDEKMIIKICQDLYDYPRIKSPFDNESFKEAQKEVQFIKSLKPQNNITDEELAQAKKDAYNDALGKIEYHSGEPTFDDGWSAAIDYIRKKYLTPQNKWKPSDEQITWLYRAVDDASKDSRMKQILNELLSDLKKLRKG